MIIVPGIPPMQGHSQTRNSRELGKHVDQAVRDYRRDHPDVTDAEVHAALAASVSAMAQSPESRANQQRVAIVAVAVTAAAIGAIVAASGGGRNGSIAGSDLWVKIVAGVAVVSGLLIALVRIVRRG